MLADSRLPVPEGESFSWSELGELLRFLPALAGVMSEFESIDDYAESGSRWKKAILWIVGILVVVGALGSIGQLIGTGWFGHRSILYGRGELYVLNMSDRERQVVVDGRPPVEILAHNATVVELIGGTSQVDIQDKAGNVVESYQITTKNSHALLNISDDTCLIVADMSAFYGGGGEKKLTYRAQLKPDQKVYVPDSTNVVWPRKSLQLQVKSGAGPATWIELIACSLFDEPEILDGLMHLRLEERMSKTLPGSESETGF